MTVFALHGFKHVAQVLRDLSQYNGLRPFEKLLTEAAVDIERRHTSDRAYAVLRVALRNAMFRIGRSNTALCPSAIYRDIESGEIGVGEATDRLEALFSSLADDWHHQGFVNGSFQRRHADAVATVVGLSEAG